VISQSFEQLVDEAWQVDPGGWNFSFLADRIDTAELPWGYRERAVELVSQAQALLDIDTGGGEFISGLTQLPPRTVAVESWPPNLEIARQRLTPLGVSVEDRLEAITENFDLILNRHGRLDATALANRLMPGGRLLTQQVGSRNHLELTRLLDAPSPQSWSLSTAVAQLEAAGLRVEHADEALLPCTFRDIGAVVYQLRMVAWQVPDFNPAVYEEKLRKLHQRILTEGGLTVHEHRFYLEAVLPTAS